MNTHQVDWSTSSNAGGILALLQVASYPPYGELETSLARPADRLLASGLSLSTSGHVDSCLS